MRWLEASPEEPAEWREAAPLGDRILWVTADEFSDLSRRVLELVGSAVTERIAARIGIGWAYTAGCLLFTAPLGRL